MRIRDKGPSFIVYPYDSLPELNNQIYYSRSAWQVSKMKIEYRSGEHNEQDTGWYHFFSLFITTGYIAFLVYDRQQELQKLTQYTESWSVAQLVSEYYRFESWLGLYATDTDDVTIDQVRMRLEIMLSQSDLMKVEI